MLGWVKYQFNSFLFFLGGGGLFLFVLFSLAFSYPGFPPQQHRKTSQKNNLFRGASWLNRRTKDHFIFFIHEGGVHARGCMAKNTKMRVSKTLLDKYQPTLHCRFERWFLSSSEVAVSIFPPRLTNTETRGKQLKTLPLFSRKPGKARFPLFTRQYYEPILLFFFLRNLRVVSRPNFLHLSWFLPTLDSIDVFYSGLFHFFFLSKHIWRCLKLNLCNKRM